MRATIHGFTTFRKLLPTGNVRQPGAQPAVFGIRQEDMLFQLRYILTVNQDAGTDIIIHFSAEMQIDV